MLVSCLASYSSTVSASRGTGEGKTCGAWSWLLTWIYDSSEIKWVIFNVRASVSKWWAGEAYVRLCSAALIRPYGSSLVSLVAVSAFVWLIGKWLFSSRPSWVVLLPASKAYTRPVFLNCVQIDFFTNRCVGMALFRHFCIMTNPISLE
jgi:hypothetical protein